MLEINWKCLTLKMFIDIESIFLAYKIMKRMSLLIFTRICLDGWP